MILVDTDIFIDHFRNFKSSTAFIENTAADIAVSVLTVTEILSGKDCEKSEVRSQIEDFFSSMKKIEVDLNMAKKAGEFRRVYGISLVDAIIAATAFELKIPLCSRNKKDFGKIKQIELKIPY